jgi:hypothetical protein
VLNSVAKCERLVFGAEILTWGASPMSRTSSACTSSRCLPGLSRTVPRMCTLHPVNSLQCITRDCFAPQLGISGSRAGLTAHTLGRARGWSRLGAFRPTCHQRCPRRLQISVCGRIAPSPREAHGIFSVIISLPLVIDADVHTDTSTSCPNCPCFRIVLIAGFLSSWSLTTRTPESEWKLDKCDALRS